MQQRNTLTKKKNAENTAKWRLKNTGKKVAYQKYYDNLRRSDPEYKLPVVKRLAKRRNILWEISDEMAIKLFKEECHYCNLPARLDYCNGIDRVDNNKGYIVNNVVPCCQACNYMKNTMNKQNFIQQIRCIYEHCINKA